MISAPRAVAKPRAAVLFWRLDAGNGCYCKDVYHTEPETPQTVSIIRPMLVRLITSLPKARRWIARTVAEHQSQARPLPSLGFARLPEYFPAALLNRVSVIVVDRTPRPPLDAWGLQGVDDFGVFEAAGITLGDSIFVRRGCEGDESLVFHELIHVIQWRMLGINRFLGLYGLLLLERGYTESPLEVMAYDMQSTFDAQSRVFDASVVAERRTQEAFANARKQSLMHRVAFALLR